MDQTHRFRPTAARATAGAPGGARSRRAVLSGAALAAFWGEQTARAGEPARHSAAPPVQTTGAGPLVRLIQRVTVGLTASELQAARQLGREGYLEHQLAYESIDDSVLAARLANYATLTMEPYQLFQLQPQQVVNELIEATILRPVLSRRQLLERMVEFWTDHFNIDINKNLDRFLKTVDDREVIRANALGTFPALLSASAHSPAMLYYLDNNVSFVGNPNENYARELLELHTMGADGAYTQVDIEEVARCFTGWTLYPANAGVNAGKFRFLAGQHDNGAKQVLGYTIPAGGGYNDGLIVLDILANHPDTARYVSAKLCRWLYQYDPPAPLVSSVAATYAATGGDIRSMIRTALLKHDLAAAEPKYKRPYHLFVSALRACGATITNVNGIRSNLLAAGQVPYNWGPPDGYPDNLDFWVGLVLPRWNFGASLLNSQVNGASVDINAFFAGVPNNADALAAHIDRALFGGEMDPFERQRIRDYLLPNAPTTQRKRDALGLAIASPGYQWY